MAPRFRPERTLGRLGIERKKGRKCSRLPSLGVVARETHAPVRLRDSGNLTGQSLVDHYVSAPAAAPDGFPPPHGMTKRISAASSVVLAERRARTLSFRCGRSFSVTGS